MDPSQATQLLQSGIASHQAGDLVAAEAAYRRVLAAIPNHADALHLLGVLAAQCGHAQNGEQLIRRAIAIHPVAAEFHFHLGEVLVALKRQGEAVASMLEAARLDPKNAGYRSDAGGLLLALGRVNEGVEQMRQAVALAPQNPLILANFGFGLSRLGRTDDAVRELRRATELAPDHPGPWTQLGEVLWRAQDYDQAIVAARRAVALAPNNPPTLILLGNTLQTLAEFEEAAEVYRKVKTLAPDNFDAHSNLALTVLKMGEATQSLELYDQVLQRWPTSADARANRSLAMLTLGDFERGWEEYEARWSSTLVAEIKVNNQPRWNRADPAGRTILLTTEQGLGDVIQFVRYAKLIADRGGKVIVACAADLKPVVATVPGVSAVVSPSEFFPRFDVFAPVASLPRIFHTTLETIPAHVPYITADAQRVAAWRDRLADDANVKVGLVWAGTPRHLNDRARSCRLADFAPLAAVAGVTFYSLQKGPPAAQASEAPAGMRIVSLGDDLRDFADTAALLQCLDLLISVDTSVVHLAGALARPVWTLLARGPDWRWMLDRSDSPWYPTMRLFRQPRLRDWPAVMSAVANDLAAFVAQRKENP
ncbi:MAG: tetratricopeptide repeat protein [Tepidisphaeraceae bacterium]